MKKKNGNFKILANYSRLPKRNVGIYSLWFSRTYQWVFAYINRSSEPSRVGNIDIRQSIQQKRIGFEIENKVSLTFMREDKIYNISLFTKHTEIVKKINDFKIIEQ